MGLLQELATRHGITIIVVHHVRKAGADDVMDTVSGTLGLTGTADSIIVLGKSEKGVRLCVSGRDLEEEADKVVRFDRATAKWTVLGDYAAVAEGTARPTETDRGLAGSGWGAADTDSNCSRSGRRCARHRQESAEPDGRRRSALRAQA